ncbi:hypothetical protein EYC59_06560 [Candidatus Saccharibacteria bacterium]|nr:MAG: hypothetical protein EYC59_06560 [Candidatus Saccharibacteria bacterium]
MALLVLSVVLFVGAALLPFAVRATEFSLVVAFGSIDGGKPSCEASGSLVQANQCAMWLAPDAVRMLSVGGIVAVLVAGAALNYYATRRLGADGERFARTRFIVSAGAAVAVVIAYGYLRVRSQNNGFSNFGFFSVHMTNGAYVPSQTVQFGYGMGPALFVLLITAFLVPAYMSWYRFSWSPRFVKGHKKAALFQ